MEECASDKQLDLEEENPNICKELEAGVSRKKIASDKEKPQLEEMKLIMKEVTETLEANFTDSEIDFVKALKSMQKNTLAIKTKAGLFSAMYNFVKVQY